MATNFQDASGEIRLVGTIYAPGATVGDVFTVQADGSLAPASGGGSQPGTVVVKKLDFAFDTPNIETGVPIYTPAVGDLILYPALAITAFFDVAAFAHVGTYLNASDEIWTGNGFDLSNSDSGTDLGQFNGNQGADQVFADLFASRAASGTYAGFQMGGSGSRLLTKVLTTAPICVKVDAGPNLAGAATIYIVTVSF